MTAWIDSIIIWGQHHLYTTLLIMWVLSNAANYLPKPQATSGPFYVWFYGFSQATFGMVPRLLATMMPNSWLGKLAGSGVDPKQP